MSELYTSVRFASLSPAYKHATSVQVLLFFAQGIDASADGELPTANPPYLYTRGKKRVKAHGRPEWLDPAHRIPNRNGITWALPKLMLM